MCSIDPRSPHMFPDETCSKTHLECSIRISTCHKNLEKCVCVCVRGDGLAGMLGYRMK